MTTDDASLVNAEAQEYLQLRRAQELQKLKAQLAEEEVEQDLNQRRKCRGSAVPEPTADGAVDVAVEEDHEEDEDDGPDEQVEVVFETQSLGLCDARLDVAARVAFDICSDVDAEPDSLDRLQPIRDVHGRLHGLGVRQQSPGGFGVRPRGHGVQQEGDGSQNHSDRGRVAATTVDGLYDVQSLPRSPGGT